MEVKSFTNLVRSNHRYSSLLYIEQKYDFVKRKNRDFLCRKTLYNLKGMSIEKIIGENLKRFRKKKGYTKQYIAKFLGVKWDTVNKWEKGIFKPGLDKLQKLADLFEISLDDLLKPPEKEPFPGFNDIMALPVRERYEEVWRLAGRKYGIEALHALGDPLHRDEVPLLETEEEVIEEYQKADAFFKRITERIQKEYEKNERRGEKGKKGEVKFTNFL